MQDGICQNLMLHFGEAAMMFRSYNIDRTLLEHLHCRTTPTYLSGYLYQDTAAAIALRQHGRLFFFNWPRRYVIPFPLTLVLVDWWFAHETICALCISLPSMNPVQLKFHSCYLTYVERKIQSHLTVSPTACPRP